MTPLSGPHINNFEAEKERLENAGRFRWFHWAIIIASFTLTITVWYYAYKQQAEKKRATFERYATQAVELVTERMAKYEDALASGAAALKAHDLDMTVKEWETFATALHIETKYPGINGIGLIDRVSPDERESYLTKQRLDRPDFKIHPAHDAAELFPIVYIEPVSTNAAAVGLDMAHEANRYTAARKARNTGEPQITGPIILVQDARKTPGFLFFQPYFKGPTPDTIEARQAAFGGLVYAPFIFDRLIEGTLKKENRLVSLKIEDDGTVLLNEHPTEDADFDPNPVFSQTVERPIYGRNWMFEIRTTKAFRSEMTNNKPWIILIGGLLLNFLLLGLFTLLIRSNRRAISFANRMSDGQKTVANRLNNIVENAVDGLMTITKTGRIESYNKACEDIFGYKTEDVLGRHVTLLVPGLKDSYEELYISPFEINPSLEKDKKIIGQGREIEGQKKNGVLIDLSVSISEIWDDGRALYNTIVRDITEQKQAQQALQRTLEDLTLSNQELEKFAYVASHDLKSPLRAIDNLSCWLEEDLESVMDEENKDRMSKLRGRVARMEKLLAALLAYSRAGRLAHVPPIVNAQTLVGEVRDTLDFPKEFSLVLDKSLEDIEIERMPMEQVFHNLISNAVKHHDKATGKITISGEETETGFKFFVKDDGPGIETNFHDKIFEMFQTLKPRDEVEGSGMGLAFVKKALYHHGGDITVQSEYGKGSIFVVTWPKNPRKRTHPAEESIKSVAA